MNTSKISAFMLERYKLGELLPEDKETVDKVLAEDEDLRSCLAALDGSDRELRLHYPFVDMKLSQRMAGTPRRVWLAVAAGILVCLFIPVLYYFLRAGTKNPEGIIIAAEAPGDRAKGQVLAGAELSLYLKGDQEIPLPLIDQTVLREGNTVQLAYMVPAGECYGVIFSIDGRAEVTMHYPYRKGQSPLLVSGRRTFLSEAYTLDDAPDYEIFVMVVSEEPLDVDAVLSDAQRIADTMNFLSVDINTTEGKKRVFSQGATFTNCEVETLMVQKE